MRFIDTNILLYAISTRDDERAKRDIALALLDDRDLALSVQVLQEFYHQATRPGRTDALSHADARDLVESFLRFPVLPVTVEVMQAAFVIRAATGYAYWDCAILAAAQTMGCDEVLSEDMQAGRVVDGLTIVNPFD